MCPTLNYPCSAAPDFVCLCMHRVFDNRRRSISIQLFTATLSSTLKLRSERIHKYVNMHPLIIFVRRGCSKCRVIYVNFMAHRQRQQVKAKALKVV